MDRRLAEFKLDLDRIWSAHAPDFDEAVRLVQQIAAVSEDDALRQAASQALPILRYAALEGADHAACVAARRRLGVVRDVLVALTTLHFGRRSAAAKILTLEERSRALLGLPLDCRLSVNEIHHAYKLLAKRAHPDVGGTAEAFLRISAAQEALLRERRTRPHH